MGLGASKPGMQTKSLFHPFPLGPIQLKNRIVMAPLTRSRAGEGDAPGDMNAEYYEQRASAGLIISEATQVSKQGQGYLWTPGIYTQPQVEGWRKVVKSVHDKGGKIFLQMWHVGRVSHTSLQPGGAAPISSTEKAAENTYSFTLDENGQPGNLPASKPAQASIEQLRQVIADYGRGARNAKEAGFDGAEVHGANGYLFDQFLNSVVNERGDEYGNQTKESRARLLLEAFDAVAEVLGSARVGVRIAPFGNFGDMKRDPNTEETFLYVAEELTHRGAVYLHIVRGSQLDPEPVVPFEFFKKMRQAFQGTILITGGLNQSKAEDLLAQGVADLLGFGTLFISNPDLPERFRNGWPLAAVDPTTLYGGAARGYTDYPSYKESQIKREVKEPLDIR